MQSRGGRPSLGTTRTSRVDQEANRIFCSLDASRSLLISAKKSALHHLDLVLQPLTPACRTRLTRSHFPYGRHHFGPDAASNGEDRVEPCSRSLISAHTIYLTIPSHHASHLCFSLFDGEGVRASLVFFISIPTIWHGRIRLTQHMHSSI